MTYNTVVVQDKTYLRRQWNIIAVIISQMLLICFYTFYLNLCPSVGMNDYLNRSAIHVSEDNKCSISRYSRAINHIFILNTNHKYTVIVASTSWHCKINHLWHIQNYTKSKTFYRNAQCYHSFHRKLKRKQQSKPFQR